ncbi:hypothetical protein BN2475_470199 [Paraburkholderia ribeironis]|uniref:Uncharacterized protein n=1 Tax=Paraburkholderia ribeironis TaxID=1247936 RepID=A0A1N7SAQ9_9BURK|nr:hypothetical protein BN2475_470199 [Paraburkholderia ribeironis]
MSMPRPAQADIRCSTVDTRAPSFCNTEARRVSPIAIADAGMSTGVGKSTRENTMPVSGAAGRSVRLTLRPECRPMPTVLTIDLIVRCFNMVIFYSIKNPNRDFLFHSADYTPLPWGASFPGTYQSVSLHYPIGTIRYRQAPSGKRDGPMFRNGGVSGHRPA